MSERQPPMPINPGDLLIDTLGLELEEIGAFTRLLSVCWSAGPGPLPQGEDSMARVAGIGLRRWRRIWPRIMHLFVETHAGWLPAKLDRFGYGDVPRVRPPLDDQLRRRVWEKTGGLCQYCGVGMTVGERCPTEFTVDHIHPFSRGGTETINNLVPACRACNAAKGARLQ